MSDRELGEDLTLCAESGKMNEVHAEGERGGDDQGAKINFIFAFLAHVVSFVLND